MTPPRKHRDEKTNAFLFSEIFRQHEKRLYAFALRVVKSEHLAQDIIQEVFLKLWEQRQSISAINNMEAWLYRVTENKVIDFLRKASADANLRRKILDNMQVTGNETESYVTERSYNQVLQAAINDLPEQRRLIYLLSREDGLKPKQIAEQLHLSRQTVKNQLVSAVKLVRDRLNASVKNFFSFF